MCHCPCTQWHGGAIATFELAGKTHAAEIVGELIAKRDTVGSEPVLGVGQVGRGLPATMVRKIPRLVKN